MANPQKENGYTAISNELSEAFCRTRIPGEARQVLDVIIRQTYGFNKKIDKIALSVFCEKTGMDKPDVCRAINKLRQMNLIVGEKANDYKTISTYGLNKNYEEWQPLAKKPISVGEKANGNSEKPLRHIEQPLAKKPPTKDKYKDNTKDSSGYNPLGAELIKSFEVINPACKNFYGRPDQRKACNDLIAVYTFERVKNVIEKTLPRTNNIQYLPTITTPVQLRDKWASLEAGIAKLKGKQVENKPKVAFS